MNAILLKMISESSAVLYALPIIAIQYRRLPVRKCFFSDLFFL